MLTNLNHPCFSDYERHCLHGEKCDILTSIMMKNLIMILARCKRFRMARGYDRFEWIGDAYGDGDKVYGCCFDGEEWVPF